MRNKEKLVSKYIIVNNIKTFLSLKPKTYCFVQLKNELPSKFAKSQPTPYGKQADQDTCSNIGKSQS